MIHPDTELKFVSEEIGHGVFATKTIQKGTITWAMDELDREFAPSQITEMNEKLQDIIMTYTYRNNRGNHIFCWDHGKYLNHSFNPNIIATPYNFELAIRDIMPGEQLTNDYGYLNIIEPFCPYPEPGSTRNMVYPDDLLRYASDWDQKLHSAFNLILSNDQPLWKILPEATRTRIRRIIDKTENIHSIKENYFDSARN